MRGEESEEVRRGGASGRGEEAGWVGGEGSGFLVRRARERARNLRHMATRYGRWWCGEEGRGVTVAVDNAVGGCMVRSVIPREENVGGGHTRGMVI